MMRNTKVKIASAANQLFSQRGFAEPGVEAIRKAADVSIRTLYKHFPSREDMVVGALAFRHFEYLAHLRDGMPSEPGERAIIHFFDRVGDWMAHTAVRGCLFVQAVASHPDSVAIQREVQRNKQEVRLEIASRLPADRQSLLTSLFLLHEGTTAAATSLGSKDACTHAVQVVRHLFATASDQSTDTGNSQSKSAVGKS
ncbi:MULTISPECIES: TetR/AcrR family transcriptional regulator [unclassified Mesorhizobium]|uniref:TetR/AcrR family transcriptional regulator n=1 Tax=unclassified Mesorhizobium TaxID=325217 RepID=UPI0003CF40E2|nr:MULTISPECIES: TetR/AcrR family transcriptional regulator [unclassified Mesorhizobium]ESX76041.1 TetR family transcriptional regulator [Mesorhizobium sp. LSHC414A00]ESX98782.1 hypothetical protein X753_31040 [Mesorhizobium sp. LNJC399B00]WJI67478.1 TetR/AcrR family transcriptional regulator [Mesorhizobium sp. C399B]